MEAWGRFADNPIGGWYGLKKGFRGRFGVYLPPLMEALGLCELEHNPKNNRMRASDKTQLNRFRQIPVGHFGLIPRARQVFRTLSAIMTER